MKIEDMDRDDLIREVTRLWGVVEPFTSREELNEAFRNLREQRDAAVSDRAQMAEARADAAVKAAVKMNAQKDNAYNERDRCVSVIACLARALGWPVWLGTHEGDPWDDDWRNIVFIETPHGQVSWHYHDSERPMFSWISLGMPAPKPWDGHSTPAKYNLLFGLVHDGIPSLAAEVERLKSIKCDKVDCDRVEKDRQKALDQVAELEETIRMREAAISVAAQCNTRASAKQHRIERGNPYWTITYDDVCRTVDREMDYRERLDALTVVARDAANLRLFVSIYDGRVLDQPRGLAILDSLDRVLAQGWRP